MRWSLLRRRLLRGLSYGLGLGLILGAAEATLRSWLQLRILITPLAWATTFAAWVTLSGMLGALFGVVATAALHPFLGRDANSRFYLENYGLDLKGSSLPPVLSAVAFCLVAIGTSPSWARGGAPDPLLVPMLLCVTVSVFFAARLGFRRADDQRVGLATFPAIAALALIGCFGLGILRGIPGGRGGGRRVHDALPNLLLVTVDGLRSDYLGANAPAGRVRTQAIDYQGEQGILLSSVISPTPDPTAGSATLLTGRHPLAHGVVSPHHRLGLEFETLAEFLGSQGYSTGAFVSHLAVGAQTGLSQGFEVYDDDFSARFRGLESSGAISLVRRIQAVMGRLPDSLRERSGDRSLALARSWLQRHGRENFFLWVQLADALPPFDPRGVPGFEDNGSPGSPRLDHRALIAEGRLPDDSESARLSRMYAEEVSWVDRQIEELLRVLERTELLDNTVIIIASATGTNLTELAGVPPLPAGLHDSAVRLPATLYAPGQQLPRRRVRAQVRLMDLFPTALHVIGFRPALRMEGRNLAPMLRGEEIEPLQALLLGHSSAQLLGPMTTGLRTSDGKYLRDEDGRERFYALQFDPNEARDSSAEQQPAVEAARAWLNTSLGGTAPDLDVAPTPDPVLVEALRQMGYPAP